MTSEPKYKMSEAARQKIKECWKNPEHRKRMSQLIKSRWRDPEYRNRVIESQKARWNRLKEGRKSKK
jgi:hypothetical protein